LTDYSGFYKRFVDAVWCTPAAGRTRAAGRAAALLPGVPWTTAEGKQCIPASQRSHRTLFLTEGRGTRLGACPGSRGHLCCNYLTVNLYEGCPIGCTYCIMQSYLNFPPVTVNVDAASVIGAIERTALLNRGKTVRIGTGETGDSLFYDPLFDLSRPLVEACARFPNVVFELKTKTHFVDHLLAVRDKGRAVVGFSLNPPEVIAAEEPFSSSLDERLAAARRARDAGYGLAFHFDPVIRFPGWENAYRDTIGWLGELVRTGGREDRIAWVSIGTMRFPGELKDRLAERPYRFDEYVRSRDGKFRYPQPVRRDMYSRLLAWIRPVTRAPVYLCMESPAVWKKVFGFFPAKTDGLCAIFDTISVADANRAAR
jgi:spore photoproduct lyase